MKLKLKFSSYSVRYFNNFCNYNLVLKRVTAWISWKTFSPYIAPAKRLKNEVRIILIWSKILCQIDKEILKALKIIKTVEKLWVLLLKTATGGVLLKKGVLRKFAKVTGKYLCQSLFFNKVAGLRPFSENTSRHCFCTTLEVKWKDCSF